MLSLTMVLNYASHQVPWQVLRLIKDLRNEHLDSGGDPRDFPDWIVNQGIQMKGFDMQIKDDLYSFSIMKYGT